MSSICRWQDGGAGRVHLAGQQPGKKLHHCYLQADLAQAVAGFETQEAAADQHRGFGRGRRLFDPVGIIQGPQGKDPGGVRPLHGRDKGIAAGGQEELVEGETLPLVGLHKFLVGVDPGYPGVEMQVDPVLVVPALGMNDDLVRRPSPPPGTPAGRAHSRRAGTPGKRRQFCLPGHVSGYFPPRYCPPRRYR